MMVIKNGRLKKQKSKKSSYPLLGTHQDGWTGVSLKMKQKQKNCGHKYGSFLCLMTGDKKMFDLKRTKNKYVFCCAIFF